MDITKDDIAKIVDAINPEDDYDNFVPSNSKYSAQITYLQRQLKTARELIHNKQQKINELEEALKKVSFQSASQMMPLDQSPSQISREDIFNIMVNKSYVVLDFNL